MAEPRRYAAVEERSVHSDRSSRRARTRCPRGRHRRRPASCTPATSASGERSRSGGRPADAGEGRTGRSPRDRRRRRRVEVQPARPVAHGYPNRAPPPSSPRPTCAGRRRLRARRRAASYGRALGRCGGSGASHPSSANTGGALPASAARNLLWNEISIGPTSCGPRERLPRQRPRRWQRQRRAGRGARRQCASTAPPRDAGQRVAARNASRNGSRTCSAYAAVM